MKKNYDWFNVRQSEDEHSLEQLKLKKSYSPNYRNYISLFEFQELVSKFLCPSMNSAEKDGYRQFVSILKKPEKTTFGQSENLNLFCLMVYNLFPSDLRINLDPSILGALQKDPQTTEIYEEKEPVSPTELHPALGDFYDILKEYMSNCSKKYYRIYRRTLLGSGLDPEDLEQESVYGLNSALKSYDHKRPFIRFAKICIKRYIITKCKYTAMMRRSGVKTVHACEMVVNGRKFKFIESLPQRYLNRKTVNYDHTIKSVSKTLRKLTPREFSHLRLAIHETRSPQNTILYKSIDNSLQRVRKKYLTARDVTSKTVPLS